MTLLDHYADDRRVLVLGHTLMSNHFHLVVTGQEDGVVSRLLQHVTGQYAQYLHGTLNRRGRLWQSRFYSSVLDAHHFLTTLAYVDLNPVRAGHGGNHAPGVQLVTQHGLDRVLTFWRQGLAANIPGEI